MTGRKLGRFEIIREIGKGAMGVVYLAHDPKIDRKIAIKMISLPAGLSPDEARESGHRFVREAQAAGKLQHPNIITIYDVVEEDGRSYITMEYIDGETLEHYARPGSSSLSRRSSPSPPRPAPRSTTPTRTTSSTATSSRPT